MNKKISLKSDSLIGYEQLLLDIRSILDKGKFKAYQAVDALRIQSYWQVGERIVREELKHKGRADYGKQSIKYLSKDLNFSTRLIFEMIQFYRIYPIVRTVSAQLTWSHFTTLIRINNTEIRKFYEIQSVKNSWSIRELRKRIKQNEYEKARKTGNIDLTIPQKLPLTKEVFKDTYHWDFLQLEKKLKNNHA